MLNIAEQLGIRNARRNGLRPYRARNNSHGRSAEETTAGQCQRLAGHGRVSIKERRREPRANSWRSSWGIGFQSIAFLRCAKAQERLDESKNLLIGETSRLRVLTIANAAAPHTTAHSP